MAKLHCLNLMIEITRRCNMRCNHCLRGDAEDLDMSQNLVQDLFAGVKSVDVLTFCGGEPTLAVPQMRWALDECRKNGIDVREVYIVTNGLVVSDEFVQACRDWHSYCIERQFVADGSAPYIGGYEAKRILKAVLSDNADGRSGCVVAVSLDAYHDDIPFGNLARLAALPRLVLDKAHDMRDDYRWLLHEGRAAFNGMGDPDMKSRTPWAYGDRGRQIDLEPYPTGDACVENLYVNAEGSLLKGCDYSYVTQEDYILGHVDGPGWADRFIKAHKNHDIGEPD